VLAQYTAGRLIMRTPVQAKIVKNYLITLKKFTPPLPERYVPTLKFCDSVKEGVQNAMKLPL
jgi:hypothetical protein